MSLYLAANAYCFFRGEEAVSIKRGLSKILALDAVLLVIFGVLAILAALHHLPLLHGVTQNHLVIGFGVTAGGILCIDLIVLAVKKKSSHPRREILVQEQVQEATKTEMDEEPEPVIETLDLCQMALPCIKLFRSPELAYIIVKKNQPPYLQTIVPGFYARTHSSFRLSIDPAQMPDVIWILLETISKPRFKLQMGERMQSYGDLLQINLGFATSGLAKAGPCKEGEVVINVIPKDCVESPQELLGAFLADVQKELITHRIKPRTYSGQFISGSGYFFTNHPGTSRELLMQEDTYGVIEYEQGMENNESYSSIPFAPNLSLESQLLLREGCKSPTSPFSSLPAELVKMISDKISTY